jgi:hypothetical protein
MDNTLIGRFQNWFSHPFNSGGSALTWVLFVGLIIIAGFLWNLVLIELTKEI